MSRSRRGGLKGGRRSGKAARGFRQSGEFKESKGTGVAGAGLRDKEQKAKGRQAAADLREKNLSHLDIKPCNILLKQIDWKT